MVDKYDEEVDEAPTPSPVPNRLDETLIDIRKAIDTYIELMAMQTQQNLRWVFKLSNSEEWENQ